jgi:hypothetical protein
VNGDFVYLVFAALVPPIWFAIGLAGVGIRRAKRRS